MCSCLFLGEEARLIADADNASLAVRFGGARDEEAMAEEPVEGDAVEDDAQAPWSLTLGQRRQDLPP